MKQVSAFQTDDGQLFVDEGTARTHELDEALQTIGGVSADILRNAMHGSDGTKAIRLALVELGDEVTRQDNEPASDPAPSADTPAPDMVSTDNGHFGTDTKPAA